MNQKLSSGSGSSTTIGGSHRICSRILWEGFGYQQTVQVSLLEDPEVCRALDLCSFSEEFDSRCGDSCYADIQPHLAALPHCGALQPLQEARGRCLCWGGKVESVTSVFPPQSLREGRDMIQR